jgi:nucleoside permease NupC
MDILFGILAFIFIIILYFLPTQIASKRKNKNINSIFVINLFFGWTLLGWCISLAWALIKEDNQKPENISEKLNNIKKMLDEGTITEEEYNNTRKSILDNY